MEKISFSLIPEQYKIVFAQYILFTYPIQQDYAFLLAGGVPLDIISWINFQDFIPSKLKDIDLTIKLDANKPIKYYENIINEIDIQIKNFYQLNKCLSKVGNFDGSVPPTSQFTFDKQLCIKILNSDIFETLPIFIQFLIKLISNYNGKIECVDVIPFLDSNNNVTDDINNDSIRRDCTINSMYINLSFDVITEIITIGIIDPLNYIHDLFSYTLRTPLDPATTFTLDPRRLSRIPKMVEKMLRLFGQCNIAEDLIMFINDSNDLKEVIGVLNKQYPNREPLHIDILNVLNSMHFEQVIGKILIYPEMFKLFCGINPIVNINVVPINEIMDIHKKLLEEGINQYDCNVLVIIIFAYKLTTNVNTQIFTQPDLKLQNQYLLNQNNCTLYQYTKIWLPLLDNKIFILINVLNFVGQHEIGTDLWYYAISQFILLTHGATSFNTIKNANDAYKYVYKIIKIKKCFCEHNFDFLEEFPICSEIYKQIKLKIMDINSSHSNKKEMIETIKNFALVEMQKHLQTNIKL